MVTFKVQQWKSRKFTSVVILLLMFQAVLRDRVTIWNPNLQNVSSLKSSYLSFKFTSKFNINGIFNGNSNKSLFDKFQKKSRLLIYLETHFNIHNFNESYE